MVCTVSCMVVLKFLVRLKFHDPNIHNAGTLQLRNATDYVIIKCSHLGALTCTLFASVYCSPK
jgi:hypothetical protein